MNVVGMSVFCVPMQNENGLIDADHNEQCRLTGDRIKATLSLGSALASHGGKYKCNGLHDNYHYLHIVAKEDAEDGGGTVTPTSTNRIRISSTALSGIFKTTMSQGQQWKGGDTSQEEEVEVEYYDYEDYEMKVVRLRNSTSSADVEDYDDYAMSGDYSTEEAFDGDGKSSELLRNRSSGTSTYHRLKGLIRTRILFGDYDEKSNLTTAVVPEAPPRESTTTYMMPIEVEMTVNGASRRFPGTSVAQSEIDRWSWRKQNDTNTTTKGDFNGSPRKVHFEREWDEGDSMDKDLSMQKEVVGGNDFELLLSGGSSTNLAVNDGSRNVLAIENVVVEGVGDDDAVLVGENFTIRCNLIIFRFPKFVSTLQSSTIVNCRCISLTHIKKSFCIPLNFYQPPDSSPENAHHQYCLPMRSEIDRGSHLRIDST